MLFIRHIGLSSLVNVPVTGVFFFILISISSLRYIGLSIGKLLNVLLQCGGIINLSTIACVSDTLTPDIFPTDIVLDLLYPVIAL